MGTNRGHAHRVEGGVPLSHNRPKIGQQENICFFVSDRICIRNTRVTLYTNSAIGQPGRLFNDTTPRLKLTPTVRGLVRGARANPRNQLVDRLILEHTNLVQVGTKDSAKYKLHVAVFASILNSSVFVNTHKQGVRGRKGDDYTLAPSVYTYRRVETKKSACYFLVPRGAVWRRDGQLYLPHSKRVESTAM